MTHLNNIYLIGKIIKIMHFYIVNFSFTFLKHILLYCNLAISFLLTYVTARSQLQFPLSSPLPISPFTPHFPSEKGRPSRCQPNRAYQIIIRLRIFPHIKLDKATRKNKRALKSKQKCQTLLPLLQVPQKDYATVAYT